MQVPTGGTAHEPQGMIRCDSEADSIVWMREDSIGVFACMVYCSGMIVIISELFLANISVFAKRFPAIVNEDITCKMSYCFRS